jgi:hypothetical protein
MRRRVIATALLISIFAGLSCDGSKSRRPSGKDSDRAGVAEAVLPSEDKLVAGQTLYVPLYSHVYTADNAEPLNLAATVFVRNSDRTRPILLTRVQYYDSGGKLLRDFLVKPLRIAPMASMDFFVKESDESGGASPSFLVEWVAESATSEPVIESVMIGTSGTQGISFTCPAHVVSTRKP